MSKVKNKPAKKKRLFAESQVCGICGEPISIVDLYTPRITLDHITPRYHGGTNEIANLQLAHRKCDLEKGHGEMKAPAPLTNKQE